MKKLFSIFTRPEKVEAALADVLAHVEKHNESKTTSDIVEQIHHEFFTAADNLLEEARSIIASADQRSQEKAKRLDALGFTSAREVGKYRDLRMQTEMSKETVQMIETYRKKFPDNKFITTEQAKLICDKYDLYIGSTDRYKGFVPEKNLMEIEKFVKKYKTLDDIWIQTRQNELLILENAEIYREKNSPYAHIRKKGSSGDWPERAFQLDNIHEKSIYGADHNNLFGLAHMGHISGVLVPARFQIAAPIQDMNVEKSQIKDRTISEIITFPDPVVLNPVKGGYIIVTAWGDEAEDPIVKD